MPLFNNRRRPAQRPPTESTLPTVSATPVNASDSVDPPALPVGFETVLGRTSALEGHLSSAGNLRLDGRFKGTLDIQGNVLVGEGAHVEADIDGRNISIAGSVRGNVSGKKVQILRTGRVWGDIHATTLTTEEGALIDGKIAMAAPSADLPGAAAHEQPSSEHSDNPDGED